MSHLEFELRRLSYFIAVVEQGSFRNAAKAIHVSQPPLTRQIKLLEEEVGVKLLKRTSDGSKLTSAGREFYNKVKRIEALSAEAVQSAKMADSGMLGTIDIGVFGSAVLATIPRIVQKYREVFPHVKVALHSLDRESQLKALREKRIDAGFNWFFPGDAEINRLAFKKEPLLVALHESHPLSGAKQLSIKQLINETLILFPRVGHPNFADHVLHIYRKSNLSPHSVEEVDDVVTAVALVSCGLGISLVVTSANTHMSPGVKFIPLKMRESDGVELCLYSRNDNESTALKNFKEIAVAYFQN